MASLLATIAAAITSCWRLLMLRATLRPARFGGVARSFAKADGGDNILLCFADAASHDYKSDFEFGENHDISM